MTHVAPTPGYGLPQRAPLVDETTGRVFVAGSIFPGERVSVLDTESGRLVSAPRMAGWVAGMALDNQMGQIFVADSGPLAPRVMVHGGVPIPLPPAPIGAGRVAVLDARSGRLRRTIPLTGIPAGIAVDERLGRVYVANTGRGRQAVETHTASMSAFDVRDGPGVVVGLDARTGAVMRTTTVGVNPGLLAIDARLGRGYVINDGGPVTMSAALGWIPRWLQRVLPFLPPPGRGWRGVSGSISVLPIR